MTHWYDYVFWIFFGGGILFIAGIWVSMLFAFVRDRRRTRAPLPAPTSNGGTSSETWELATSTDTSTGFDSSPPSSSDYGGSDASSGDSGGGGDFSGGGGDSGGGGSSGGWND